MRTFNIDDGLTEEHLRLLTDAGMDVARLEVDPLPFRRLRRTGAVLHTQWCEKVENKSADEVTVSLVEVGAHRLHPGCKPRYASWYSTYPLAAAMLTVAAVEVDLAALESFPGPVWAKLGALRADIGATAFTAGVERVDSDTSRVDRIRERLDRLAAAWSGPSHPETLRPFIVSTLGLSRPSIRLLHDDLAVAGRLARRAWVAWYDAITVEQTPARSRSLARTAVEHAAAELRRGGEVFSDPSEEAFDAMVDAWESDLMAACEDAFTDGQVYLAFAGPLLLEPDVQRLLTAFASHQPAERPVRAIVKCVPAVADWFASRWDEPVDSTDYPMAYLGATGDDQTAVMECFAALWQPYVGGPLRDAREAMRHARALCR